MTKIMRRLMVAAGAFAVLTAGASPALAGDRAPVVKFKDARMKIEKNDTDGDAGVQVFLDADPWQWIEIRDPNGRLLFESETAGGFAEQGGTELFLESGEPSFDHDVPHGPQLVSPLEGGPPVDPDDAEVRWDPVDPPNGSPIIADQVLIVQPQTGLAALPKIALDVMMPPTATRLAVPPGFLQRDTEYEWEVLAIERSGNQTLSSSFFRTAP